MHPVIYDVAVSLDGFIAGPRGDVSQFAHDGPVVEDYHSRMAGYDTAIMGRASYEFAYQFGLQPGQNPYPHMKTHVFSATMDVPDCADIHVERSLTPDAIAGIKQSAQGPIYLCGGGAFAGSLLAAGLIDKLNLKRAPVVLGSGTMLFGDKVTPNRFERLSSKSYDNGYLLEEFAVS
jgi:dihydrofolate reductase